MKTKISSVKLNLSIFFTVLFLSFSSTFTSCTQAKEEKPAEVITLGEPEVVITEAEVAAAQKAWGDGIVNIGKVYTEKGDYKTAALNDLNDLYGYGIGSVLFKPTMTSQKQFRTDLQGALSYFVADNPNFPEDHGFAIHPWIAVRFENIGTKINGNMAIAMGNYYFTPADSTADVKVEYSFAYTKDENGKLRIILHDSHLPFKPEKEHKKS